MLWFLIAAQLARTDPAAAASYFSHDALTVPVEGCGNRPKRPTISGIEAPWFASIWIRANEPSLAATAPTSTAPTWRFTVVPTWTKPMVFRIRQEPDGHLQMVAKRLSGQGGYDPGTLQGHESRPLTPDEQSRFVQALASVSDVLKGPARDCIVVMDGTALILERAQSGRYDIGQRNWALGSSMAAMQDLLVGFAGWNSEPSRR